MWPHRTTLLSKNQRTSHVLMGACLMGACDRTIASGSRPHTAPLVELGITPDWRLTRCAKFNFLSAEIRNCLLFFAEIRNCLQFSSMRLVSVGSSEALLNAFSVEDHALAPRAAGTLSWRCSSPRSTRHPLPSIGSPPNRRRMSPHLRWRC